MAGVKLPHPQHCFFISPAPVVSYPAAVLLDVRQAGMRLVDKHMLPVILALVLHPIPVISHRAGTCTRSA